MSDGAGERAASNGHVPDPAAMDGDADDADDGLDALDAEPLDTDEAAAGSAVADEAVDETLEERVEAVIADLDDVERRADGESTAFAVNGREFARLTPGRLEAGLDPAILKAALRTPDTASSPLGAGWIAFGPLRLDRYALDRAEAWVRFAHRRASGR